MYTAKRFLAILLSALMVLSAVSVVVAEESEAIGVSVSASENNVCSGIAQFAFSAALTFLFKCFPSVAHIYGFSFYIILM